MAENIDVRTSQAMSREAISVADIATLVSQNGVPLALDKGNNQVVVLFPSLCCNHHASKAVPQVKRRVDRFDTAEHMITVAGCKLQMPYGQLDALTTPLEERLGGLTYGQFIGLGGDFYGDPKNPVCKAGSLEQQIQQFWKNFQSLANAPTEEVQTILSIAQRYEFNPIKAAVAQDHVPSGVYAGLPKTGPHVVPDEDRAFDEATGGNLVKNGRYLNLASTNFDHFGVDAITCYMAGHIQAQRIAVEAKQQQKDEGYKSLLTAYAINAFADHFLTDLFAAGHMRTPRRALYDSAWNWFTQTSASVCAKRMHDEDNKFGLWVENELGDTWVAYGDGRYRDPGNTANRIVMKKAIQQSMDEVWEAFTSGQVRDYSNSQVLRYLPKIIKEIANSPNANAKNWAPLFWRNPGNGNVWRRNDLFNPADRNFSEQGLLPSQWGITTTVARLYTPPTTPPRMPREEYERAGVQPYPDETGPRGEFGWPPQPALVAGWQRVMTGVTGPDLSSLQPTDWRIDGTPEPTVLPGVATDIAVGPDGSIWKIDEQRLVSKWNGTDWINIPGGQWFALAIINGQPLATRYDTGQVFLRQDESWRELPRVPAGPSNPDAIDISVGADGSIWVIGWHTPNDGPIFRWDFTLLNWSLVDGGGRRIAVGANGLPWVVNSKGEIYRRHQEGTWQMIPGFARDISVGAEGSVWIIGTNKIGNDYGIYRWNEAISNWEVADGTGARIAVGPDGRPWVMNSAGQVSHF